MADQSLSCWECVPVHPEEAGQETEHHAVSLQACGWRKRCAQWCRGGSVLLRDLAARSPKADPRLLTLHIRSGVSPQSRTLFTQTHKDVSQTRDKPGNCYLYGLVATIHLFFLKTQNARLPGAPYPGGAPIPPTTLPGQVRRGRSLEKDLARPRSCPSTRSP